MQLKYFQIIVLLATIALIECGKCPKQEDRHLIHPCVCDDVHDQIVCNSEQNFNLKRIFEYLTLTIDWRVRFFKRLIISAPELTQLDETTFADIHFQEILILNALKLQQIHSHAFGRSRSSLKKLVIRNANLLNSTSAEYNFFDVLSTMNNIHEIEINGINIKGIPDNGFRPLLGTHWNLTNITIYGSIEKLGNHIIYDPSYHIQKISLGNQINLIAAHAFDMRTGSFVALTIDLSNNHLTADSFEAGVFLNSKRPLFVNLSNNRLTHFDEFIFEPYLNINIMNQIDIKDNLLVCDCRMKWLLKRRQNFERQILNAVCADGRSFWSHSLEEMSECKVNDVITDSI